MDKTDDHRRVFQPWFILGMIGMMKAAAASICDTFTAVAIFIASDWILMFIKDWAYFWSKPRVPKCLEIFRRLQTAGQPQPPRKFLEIHGPEAVRCYRGYCCMISELTKSVTYTTFIIYWFLADSFSEHMLKFLFPLGTSGDKSISFVVLLGVSQYAQDMCQKGVVREACIGIEFAPLVNFSKQTYILILTAFIPSAVIFACGTVLMIYWLADAGEGPWKPERMDYAYWYRHHSYHVDITLPLLPEWGGEDERRR
jgi:hypothetical protein